MSDRYIQLRPVSVIVDEVREEARKWAEEAYRRYLEHGEEQVRRIETNRMAFAQLDAAGLDLYLSESSRGGAYTLHLGFFPHTKAGNSALAEKVRAVRLALGCRLTQVRKGVGPVYKKTVAFTLEAADFPGLKVKFERNLPRGAKCHIVQFKKLYWSLVCEG